MSNRLQKNITFCNSEIRHIFVQQEPSDALSFPVHSTLIVLAASQRGCMINALYCMYSKLPTDDE